MKKLTLQIIAFLLLTLMCMPGVWAQLPVKIKVTKPEIKIERKNNEPSVSSPAPSPAPSTSKPDAQPTIAQRGPEQPTIVKDSIQMTPFTFSIYKGNSDVWSWVPKMQYVVNGPIPSGSQLYAEFSLPTGAWVKFDCKTDITQPGDQLKTSCGGRDIPEAKSSTFTGSVNFTIRMRNELAGTDATLFTGKMKVMKARSNESGPKVVNHFVYYADQDWNLPVGYVFYHPNDSSGWKLPELRFAFWVRGDPHNFEPHLFYQGKEIGKKFLESREVGTAACEAEVENNTTQIVEDGLPQKAKWSRVRCNFPNVKGWDKANTNFSLFGPPHFLAGNPGEYELKVLWNNRLARSIKFIVTSDGQFDNGIATTNKLGSNRVIVPVQIIGTQDGQWDQAAWKTDAFWSNPLTGFTALPPK